MKLQESAYEITLMKARESGQISIVLIMNDLKSLKYIKESERITSRDQNYEEEMNYWEQVH